MNLLKPMDFCLLPSWGGKLEKEESEIYVNAKREFINLLGERKRGWELVRQVWRLMDNLEEEYAQNNKIVCAKFCSGCCHQLVFCTAVEMDLIRHHLFALPRRFGRPIIKKLKQEAVKFHKRYKEEHGEEFEFNLLVRKWKEINDFLKKEHLGKPCVYLSAKGLCLIYKVRPWICRVAKTDTFCLERKEENMIPDKLIIDGSRTLSVFTLEIETKLIFEEIAVELIEEEQKKIYPAFEMVPLEAWPITKTFGKYFFSQDN